VPLRYYLNFEAVDYACLVWVNDVLVGGHRGGSTPFRLEVSDAVAALEQPGASRNDLVAHEVFVRVEDGTEGAQLRGKQSRKPHTIWYSRSSGVWQTVWLEAVPAVHVATLKITPFLRQLASQARKRDGPFASPSSTNPTKKTASSPFGPFAASANLKRKRERAAEDGEAQAEGSSRHGTLRVRVQLDSAPPSTYNPSSVGGFGDDGDDNARTQPFSGGGGGGGEGQSASSSHPAWSQASLLRAAVKVYASGGLTSGDGGAENFAGPSSAELRRADGFGDACGGAAPVGRGGQSPKPSRQRGGEARDLHCRGGGERSEDF